MTRNCAATMLQYNLLIAHCSCSLPNLCLRRGHLRVSMAGTAQWSPQAAFTFLLQPTKGHCQDRHCQDRQWWYMTLSHWHTSTAGVWATFSFPQISTVVDETSIYMCLTLLSEAIRCCQWQCGGLRFDTRWCHLADLRPSVGALYECLHIREEAAPMRPWV